jgi:hypothetical protein
LPAPACSVADLRPVSGNQFQHGFAIVLPEHLFPVSLHSADADTEALRYFSVSVPTYEKLHDFPAARGKSDHGLFSGYGNIRREQQFAGCMHVKRLSEIRKMPAYCFVTETQCPRYDF